MTTATDDHRARVLDACRRYAAMWSTLGPDDLDALDPVSAPGLRFVDPFVAVTGRDRVKAHLARTYERFDAIRVEVHDVAVGDQASADGGVGYIRWTFAFTRRGRPMVLVGMSEIHLDAEGRVTAHLDHWDSGMQLYAKLPVLGPIVRWIARTVGG